MQSKITSLKALTRNLWWSWDTEAKQIFEELSPLLWERNNHNPVELLRHISNDELVARCTGEFGDKIERVYARFTAYINDKNTWAANNAKEITEKPVAYFSAEFGIHESVRIYSGGLGVLSGDHVKSASDLGINFIGITLFYKEGYFRQNLNQDGWQKEDYPLQHPENLPIEKVTNPDGSDLIITVNIAQSEVYAQAYKLLFHRKYSKIWPAKTLRITQRLTFTNSNICAVTSRSSQYTKRDRIGGNNKQRSVCMSYIAYSLDIFKTTVKIRLLNDDCSNAVVNNSFKGRDTPDTIFKGILNDSRMA